MPPDITVRPLHTLDEFRRCVEITREVWGDSELETEPYITFVIAHHTGGQVLGAFDGERMVGFTKAFIAVRDHTIYLHSHMAAVLFSYRDRHVGRQLKLAQREDALRRDIRLIEWTFDPLETKNAHFNINRLGAISRRYIHNFYGITTSPLHHGMPTDRLLVEWHLDSKRVIVAINDLAPEPRECPAHVHIDRPGPQPLWTPGQSSSKISPALPAATSAAAASQIAASPEVESRSISELLELQSRLRSSLTDWFSKGYAVMSVRFTRSGVDYCLAPYSDF
jgi:predicted GNAT superfamily acetyltransferase